MDRTSNSYDRFRLWSVLGVASGVRHFAFWRITVFSGAMFDISWYLPMMGAVISGLNYGGYLHWFGPAIKTLSSIIPGANVPELWFVSRWISTTVSVWVGAWCLQKWSGLSVRDARLFSLVFGLR